MRARTRLTVALLSLAAGCPNPGCPSNNLMPWPGYPPLTNSPLTTYHWVILKCAFADNPGARQLPPGLPSTIPDLDTYINLMLGLGGIGTGNLVDYYRDVSYGAVQISPRVYGWVTAPLTTGTKHSSVTVVQQCANSLPADQLAALNLGSSWGIIAVTNLGGTAGTACYDGQQSLTIGGTKYKLACVALDPFSLWPFWAGHEVGHGLGFQHSFNLASSTPCYSAKSAGEYCDEFDIMGGAWQFYWPNYPPEGSETSHNPGILSGGAGSGLSLPNLRLLGAPPASRLATHHQGSPAEIFTLTALSHPNSSNLLGVTIAGGDPLDVYTIEYRHNDGWDAGLPFDLVLIHEVRVGATPYSFLQQGPARPAGGVSGGFTAGQSWTSPVGTIVTVNGIDTAGATATITVSN